MPVHVKHMSGGSSHNEDKDQERRFFLQDALSLNNRIQEMGVIDQKKMKKHPEVMKILSGARDNLNTLLGTGGGNIMAGVISGPKPNRVPGAILDAVKKKR